MKWIEIIQVLVSPVAILIYEIISFTVLLSLNIYLQKKRRKRKKEIVNYREEEKKHRLDKALTNEKRGGNWQ